MYSIISEIKKQTLTLMIVALGFVAGLIWKDAITAWLEPLYRDAAGPMPLTIAALVVTVVVVIITIVLTKILGTPEKS